MRVVVEPTCLTPNNHEDHVVAHEVMQELDLVLIQHCYLRTHLLCLMLPCIHVWPLHARRELDRGVGGCDPARSQSALITSRDGVGACNLLRCMSPFLAQSSYRVRCCTMSASGRWCRKSQARALRFGAPSGSGFWLALCGPRYRWSRYRLMQRNSRAGGQWWWPDEAQSQRLEVLDDGREMELVASA